MHVWILRRHIPFQVYVSSFVWNSNSLHQRAPNPWPPDGFPLNLPRENPATGWWKLESFWSYAHKNNTKCAERNLFLCLMFAQLIMEFLHLMNHEYSLPSSQNPQLAPILNQISPLTPSNPLSKIFQEVPSLQLSRPKFLCAFIFPPARFTLHKGYKLRSFSLFMSHQNVTRPVLNPYPINVENRVSS